MDGAIYPRPLSACGLDVADGLHHAGLADKCTGCGKPFTSARQRHSVCRVTLATDDEMNSWSGMLCRKCARETNGRVPTRLQNQAIQEAGLLMAKPGGTA